MSTKFSINCVTCTPSPCVLLQFAFTGQESKESWERTSMKYHMPGNLATVLIWRFSDSEVNHQIKKSPIIIIRYQSRPDTCAAPSPSSNKCTRVRRQSYSKLAKPKIVNGVIQIFPEERTACYPYPVYMWGFLSLLTIVAPHDCHSVYILGIACLPLTD